MQMAWAQYGISGKVYEGRYDQRKNWLFVKFAYDFVSHKHVTGIFIGNSLPIFELNSTCAVLPKKRP